MIFPSYSKRPLKFQRSSVNGMEATPGFEPGNKGFADLCLTAWLCRRNNGAENEIRTRDPLLGKEVLYH